MMTEDIGLWALKKEIHEVVCLMKICKVTGKWNSKTNKKWRCENNKYDVQISSRFAGKLDKVPGDW